MIIVLGINLYVKASTNKQILGENDYTKLQMCIRDRREIIYKQRREVLDGENLKDSILKMMDSSVENLVAVYTADIENVNKEAFIQDIKMSFDIDEVESVSYTHL